MIKRSPADFQVEEALSGDFLNAVAPASSAEAPFALYVLRKESLATPEAVAGVARQLGLAQGVISYGGLKDKHARTAQHITIKTAEGASLPDKAEGRGWTLERLGFVARALTAGDIQRNAFRITLRNLTAQACADMEEAARLLTPLPLREGVGGGDEHGQPTARLPVAHALRLVNYFGAQRFGSARHGAGFLARNLIRGDFEGALKLAIATEARKDRMADKLFKRTLLENWGRWREVLPKLRPCPERRAIERLANSSGDFRAAFCALPYLVQQLSVYAYQSHLWNATARRLVADLCAPRGPVLAMSDPFGEMLFPAAAAIPPELADLNLPLLARNSELVPPWKEAAEAVLREEGIAVAELQIPGVRRPFFGEEPRALFFTAENFAMSRPEADETAGEQKRRKRLLSFALPRGCYATVLLRALGQ